MLNYIMFTFLVLLVMSFLLGVQNFFKNISYHEKAEQYIDSLNLFNDNFKAGVSKLLLEKQIKLTPPSFKHLNEWNGLIRDGLWLNNYRMNEEMVLIKIILDYLTTRVPHFETLHNNLKCFLVQHLIVKYIDSQEEIFRTNYEKSLEKFKIL